MSSTRRTVFAKSSLLPVRHSVMNGHWAAAVTRKGSNVTMTVQEQFGQIDIYVFDQILRGNIVAGMRVLDAGCGPGRHALELGRRGIRNLIEERVANDFDRPARRQGARELALALGNCDDQADLR